jgi:hemerythrin-like domain-containing protein
MWRTFAFLIPVKDTGIIRPENGCQAAGPGKGREPGGGGMDAYLRTDIKELIGRFPAVGAILEEHGIGCVPCSVGTCLLSDIVEIHNLSPEEEGELLGRIAAVIDPGAKAAPVTVSARKTKGPRTITYSPPMRRLVEEHTLIKRWVALIPAVVAALDVESEEGRRTIREGVDFIRSYADRFHHAKEEDLLFAYFDEGLDILKAMRDDHERGRGRVRGIIDALERRDREGVANHLRGYAEILTEHIRKEDEILYPWMDRNLSTTQVGALYAAFDEVDARLAGDRERSERFIEKAERDLPAKAGGPILRAEVL